MIATNVPSSGARGSTPRRPEAGAAERSEAPALENIANNVSDAGHSAGNRVVRRRDRWANRALMWRVSSLRRLRHCGRVTQSKAAGVTIRERDGVAGFAGLQHCGSVWSCPVCSASILAHRALEIGSVLGQAVASGHQLGFVTFTMRHRRSQPLKTLWAAAAKAWRRSISGEVWTAEKDAHGVVGWVRVWEVTDGRNGWHVHVHFVVVLEPGRTADDLEALAAGMYGRWSAGLVSAGLEAPKMVGQKWRLVSGDQASDQLAEYLFKVAGNGDGQARSLGLELTHTQPGRARDDLKTRPVWSIFDEFTATGDADALARWHEWEAGSKGRRQVGWSKGLRARFAPELEELTDEEIAEREVGTADDDVLSITVEGYRVLVRTPAVLPLLLELTEAGDVERLRRTLDDRGVIYSWLRKSTGW